MYIVTGMDGSESVRPCSHILGIKFISIPIDVFHTSICMYNFLCLCQIYMYICVYDFLFLRHWNEWLRICEALQTHTHTHTHHTHTRQHTPTHTVFVCVFVCVTLCVLVCVLVCMWLCVCVCVCVHCMYVSMCVCTPTHNPPPPLSVTRSHRPN